MRGAGGRSRERGGVYFFLREKRFRDIFTNQQRVGE